MPVPVMVDHQKRFQAAVDVIHNLPKHGSYRPSYEVMLRFYGLYKQAVCGPCTLARPGFWDPVGRYKWDAWSRLGEMSRDIAMASYVEEMKNVAQEVIDTMPIDETTASFFHHFQPLYLVIDDMPRPPPSLLALTGLEAHQKVNLSEKNHADEEQDQSADLDPREVVDLIASSFHKDGVLPEVSVLTSDSETEIFCDSVDSVDQLSYVKIPVVKSNGFHREGRQVGGGQGGEGGEENRRSHGPSRRSQEMRREPHEWRERGVPPGSPRFPGNGGGGGRGGGDGSEGVAGRWQQDAQLQQQIILALRRLREDMRSVMERLEVVESLAATHVHGAEWRPCLRCAALPQEEPWWPLEGSGSTVLLLLLWPFVAQGLVYLLKKAAAQRRRRS